MPDLLLYTFYGDDFTGSTDVLEALATNGIETVLFFTAPTQQQLSAFPQAKAIGIAGSSRSQSPDWMDEHLPLFFRALKDLDAPVTHYKTCSTFDSAPHVGSIGRALDLGREIFANEYVPIVVAAPRLGRYVLFANLFAEAGRRVYRIDHHPTMSLHPVTPMHEADLRRHLAMQTSTPVGLIDIRAFETNELQQALQLQLNAGAKAVFFDGLDDTTAAETGDLLWSQAEERQAFAVGSSGLTYALIHAWRSRGLVGDSLSPNACVPKASTGPIVVLSGSCSPVTGAQIEWALANGFVGIAFDPAMLIARDQSAFQTYFQQAKDALSSCHSVVLYSTLADKQEDVYGEALGRGMGRLLRELIVVTGVKRIVIAGGDTSSHAVAELGLDALTFAATLQPGVPLCRAHASDPVLDGLELALKGGQIGTVDFFGQVAQSY